jgi:two-component sensor histidine kinase
MIASERLLRSPKLLNVYGEAVVDSLPHGLMVVAGCGTVVQANPAYYEMFSTTAAEVIGRNAVDLALETWGGADLHGLLVDAAAQGEASRVYIFESSVGKPVTVRCKARGVRDGSQEGVILLLEFAGQDWASSAALYTAELRHRIKNSLQLLSSFVASERRRAGGEPGGYAAIQAQIAAVGVLYEVMAGAGQSEAVLADSFFEGIARGLRSSLLQQRPDITISVEAEQIVLPPSEAEPIGLILNELATNAVKHAFPEAGGRIVLGIRRAGHAVLVSVEDDGVGIWAASRQGLGSRYVVAFAKQLGAELSCDTGSQGARFEIRIPLRQPSSAPCALKAPSKNQTFAMEGALGVA